MKFKKLLFIIPTLFLIITLIFFILKPAIIEHQNLNTDSPVITAINKEIETPQNTKYESNKSINSIIHIKQWR